MAYEIFGQIYAIIVCERLVFVKTIDYNNCNRFVIQNKGVKNQKGGRKMTQNTDEQLQRENERESMVNVIEREEVYENTYKFNVVKDPSFGHYVYVNAIGIEERTQQDSCLYNIDNRNLNEATEPNCAFQYTISGEGALRVGNKIYRQKVGDLFMVERPGPYNYWLPKDSTHWKYLFVEFSSNAIPFWNGITQAFGRTFQIKQNSELIHLCTMFFKDVRNGKVDNLLCNAQMAYKIIISLHSYLLEKGVASDSAQSINQCVKFIEENFEKNILLVDVAAAGNISPFNLNTAFKTIMGDTPMQYLNKTRIRRSMNLLYSTDLSVDDIAKQCGFQNANYFAKVFRKYLNITPTDFRRQNKQPIIL
ncbi:MAG: helix-turn-helix domain-containing protein [Tyzzerella sp.]|nr:helix-turn-helix domain-containing protein [Tyzzerella sp.]